MSISKELGESLARFKIYVDRLIALLEKHEIRNISTLAHAVRRNDSFRQEWRAIWSDIAEADGGKISLATAGAILGAALGGVGIAAMGGAFGLPLALVLGLGGLLAGAEFDSSRAPSQTKLQLLRIPKPIYGRVEAAARAAGISVNELLVRTLSTAFPDPTELESGQ